jgi:hypothetical protein
METISHYWSPFILFSERKDKGLRSLTLFTLDKIFPEFESLFSNVFVKPARALLKEGVTPEGLAEPNLSEFTHILSPNSHSTFGGKKILDITNKSSPRSPPPISETGKVLATFASISPIMFKTAKLTGTKMVMPEGVPLILGGLYKWQQLRKKI